MSFENQTYAEQQKMIRKALREQHPEWIDANGKCPLIPTKPALLNSPLSSPQVLLALNHELSMCSRPSSFVSRDLK